MATEYAKPMLDVGSPRVFNCNVLTKRLLALDPALTPFFRNKALNNLVLIKDTLPEELKRHSTGAIGTKLYFPFNENEVYEGGRTIFANDPQLERVLMDSFGEAAFSKEGLVQDLRILALLDHMPSLDPFLLKDVFLNEKIVIHEGYFDIGEVLWREIEQFILLRFEPIAVAAFPDALASDDKARRLIEKIWEARDIEALAPLIEAFRLPKPEALEIFSAWKGINFYSFQYEQMKPQFIALLTWFKDLKPPMAAITSQQRTEFKELFESSRTQLRIEWQKVEVILRDYQNAYDKMFKHKVSSADFVNFLKNSSKLYWDLGNSLGKIGHAIYCWDSMTKRFKERKLPWESLNELIKLLAKILKAEKKPLLTGSW